VGVFMGGQYWKRRSLEQERIHDQTHCAWLMCRS
jgi:hypothetical protein